MAGQYQPALDEAIARVRMLMADQNGWKVSSKSPDYMKIESKPSDKLNCSIYRTTQTVAASPQTVVDTFTVSPKSRRREWDSDMREVVMLKELSKDLWIQHITTNPVAKGVISPREFLDIVQIVMEGDGIFVCGASLPDYPSPPSKEKYVRGVMGCFTVSVTKDPSDPNKTKMVTVTEMDLKGRIPKYILDGVVPSVTVAANDKWKKFLAEKGLLQG